MRISSFNNNISFSAKLFISSNNPEPLSDLISKEINSYSSSKNNEIHIICLENEGTCVFGSDSMLAKLIFFLDKQNKLAGDLYDNVKKLINAKDNSPIYLEEAEFTPPPKSKITSDSQGTPRKYGHLTVVQSFDSIKKD